MHVTFIRRCLELAARGRGHVGNGALVGAILVRRGEIIAEGFHEGFGKAHAERALLENYKGEIREDDVLYVNLEPCSHHGKTPPCTDIVIERGVKNVVFGMIDPDMRVVGEGLKKLRAAGCELVGPVLPEECARLNRGYVSARTKGRPWITLKRAVAQGGRIADDDGRPLRITNEEQDRWSHETLRARHDAILAGIGTVLADNPNLNTRFIQDSPPLHRLIMDPSLKIPDDAIVLKVSEKSPTTIITGDKADAERVKKLEGRGARVVRVPIGREGTFVWSDVWRTLIEPDGDYHGITSILLEGGERTWETFKNARMVDEEITLIGSA